MPHNPRKPPGSGIRPYRLGFILLYGQHKWIERDRGYIRFPMTAMAKHMKMPRKYIPTQLEHLQRWGIIQSFRCHKYTATIQITVPQGMSYLVGPDPIYTEIKDGDKINAKDLQEELNLMFKKLVSHNPEVINVQ